MRTDRAIASTFSGFASSGMLAAPSRMKPPPLPTFSIKVLQYRSTSSGEPATRSEVGTLPRSQTVSPRIAFARIRSVCSNQ